MLKDSVFTFMLVAVEMFFIIFTTVYFIDAYRYKAVINAMTESVSEASVQGVDYSQRITGPELELSKSTFESKFKSDFVKNNAVSLPSAQINFQYLTKGSPVAGDTSVIKAVRVTIKDQHGTPYQVTAVANIVAN